MTRVSKKKKELLLSKYKEYQFCAEEYKKDNNIHMYEIYTNRLKAIRVTLSLLDIHIYGINQSSDHKSSKIYGYYDDNVLIKWN